MQNLGREMDNLFFRPRVSLASRLSRDAVVQDRQFAEQEDEGDADNQTQYQSNYSNAKRPIVEANGIINTPDAT